MKIGDQANAEKMSLDTGLRRYDTKKGFTLIELMIATALFVIVATIALSAILSANVNYKKTEDMRTITDNLSFTMDDISRNVKLGYNYSCNPSDNNYQRAGCEYFPIDTNPSTMGPGGVYVPQLSIGFMPYTVPNIDITADNVPAVMQGYILCQENGVTLSNGDNAGSMYKIVGNIDNVSCNSVNSSDIIKLTDDRVRINYEKSGFFVANTETVTDGDYKQPYVTIVLVGEIVTKQGSSQEVVTPFAIQTSVTERQFGQ